MFNQVRAMYIYNSSYQGCELFEIEYLLEKDKCMNIHSSQICTIP